MIRPQRLHEGDTIGIVAPSGPVQREKLKRALPFFEGLGLHVKLGKHVYRGYGYLAGTDAERLEDFHTMIADPEVKAVICARGGYGAGRIVPQLDFALIRTSPKIIWGYSDITYLHTALRQQTGLVTFHGPMPASDIAKVEFDDLSAQMFRQLFQPADLLYSEKIAPLYANSSARAEGELVGGNLSLLVSTLGTAYEIDTAGKILLLEDIGEEPYRVDGMLNQLKLAGKLSGVAGIAIGDFSGAEPSRDPSLLLNDVFDHYLYQLDVPVISGFRIGHCLPHFAVPLGTKAVLSGAEKQLKIKAGVC